MRVRTLVVALGLIGALLASREGAAQPTPTRAERAYRLEADLDVPLVLGSGAVASSIFFFNEAPGVACGLGCSRAAINGFDRGAAGNYSLAWSNVGDIATAATLAFPPLFVLLYEGLPDGLGDFLVIGEAGLVTSALQVSISYAVSRPRPRVYAADAPVADRTDANAARSFFSGHVANGVAMTFAATRTLHRIGRPTLGWVVLGVGLSGSTVIGAARILSGGHFPSDVLVGAAVGASVGLFVPWLHGSPVRPTPFVAADAGGIALSGRF